jgi:hypothetical protein
MPCYPRWASNSIPGELLMGKSRWRPEPRLLGVGLWSRDALQVTQGSSSGVSDLFDGIWGLGASFRWDSAGQRLLGPGHGLGCPEHYCLGLAAEGLTLIHP